MRDRDFFQRHQDTADAVVLAVVVATAFVALWVGVYFLGASLTGWEA